MGIVCVCDKPRLLFRIYDRYTHTHIVTGRRGKAHLAITIIIIIIILYYM